MDGHPTKVALVHDLQGHRPVPVSAAGRRYAESLKTSAPGAVATLRIGRWISLLTGGDDQGSADAMVLERFAPLASPQGATEPLG